MQFNSAAKLLQVALTLDKPPVCFRQRDFAKTDAVTGAQLRRDGKINRDHVCNFWITPNRLAISKQENGLTARRHLNRSGRDSFRNKIDIVISLQVRTLESRTHSI